jgi:hypothetical protein
MNEANQNNSEAVFQGRNKRSALRRMGSDGTGIVGGLWVGLALWA